MKKLITVLLFAVSLHTYAQHENVINREVDTLTVIATVSSFCSYSECTSLTVEVSGGVAPYSYNWSTNETTASITVCPKAATTYKVVVKDVSGLMKEVEVTATASVRPTVIASQDEVVCAGSCTTLIATGADTYSWRYNGGIVAGNNLKVCLNKPTVIDVFGISKEGCADTSFILVDVHPLPTVIITGKTILCHNESTTLTGESSFNINSYKWLPGITTGKSITITPQQTITYTLIVTDIYDCLGLDTALIKVISCTEIENVTRSSNSIDLFPNPVSDQVTISFGKEQKNATLKIIDILGKEISLTFFSGKELQMQRGNLKTGIYFIQVTSENEVIQSKKMIVY
jgi:hypothetical protein